MRLVAVMAMVAVAAVVGWVVGFAAGVSTELDPVVGGREPEEFPGLAVVR